MEKEYIDTGKVRYLYRDFPLYDIHPGALGAAHAANCAAAQGSFWPMHQRLFKGQAGEWGQGDQRDLQTFQGYATELNLDVNAFDQCLTSKRFTAQIQQDYNDAVERGVRSTPSFIINGELFVGAQPYGRWKQKLDAILAAKQ